MGLVRCTLLLRGGFWMLKAAFFDLDGTLLDDEKRIPASAREAILRARAAGVRTYIVTARSPRLQVTLGWGDAEFALFDGAIHSNGAILRLGDALHYCFIHPEAVRRCLREAACANGVEMSLHLPEDGHSFTFPADEQRLRRWRVSREQVFPIDDDTIARTLKLLIFHGDLTDDRPPLPAGLGQRLENCCEGLCRILVTDQGRTIQAVPLEAGKLNAVERIRLSLGLTMDEVTVFGDDLNDLEMIAHYPRSVAMGNGHEQVKAAAGYVTCANTAGGIAQGLRWAMGEEPVSKEGEE